MSEVVIYQAEDGKTRLEVQLEHDTVWLNQAQLVDLFQRDQSVLSRHIRNVFKEGELDGKSNMQKMHIANSDKPVAFYSLDVIISVGYRVKSQRGTQFRQWATRLLREHLVKGYTLNEQRLRDERAKLQEMQNAIDLLSRTLSNKEMVDNLGKEVLQVITDYAYALATLDRYDHGSLTVGATSGPAAFVLEYTEAIAIVQSMKDDFDGLFGQEKDQGFKSALGASTRPSMVRTSTSASKRRPLTCSTSLSRTTPSPTATNALPLPCSSSFWPATAFSTVRMAPSGWPTTPWWRSPC